MRAPWPMILLLTAFLFVGGTLACGGGDDDGDVESSTPTATPTTADEPVGVDDLAHAVVQIFAMVDGDPIWSGSGTFISKDGLILTNAHVVDERFDEYDELGVGLTIETDTAPDIEFLAEIAAVDYTLDLAVVQLTETIDGGRILEDFPYVNLGDSDTIEIGDEIQVLGYPSIGGETITLTRGAVSGFTTDRLVGSRAWIKTDATIAGGNSGGLAVNRSGELIGVPTVVGSGSASSYADCRILEDTNGDGTIDTDDTCVTVGGFINGIRPVNLALDLIDSVMAGDLYVSPYDDKDAGNATAVPDDYDTSDIFFENITFSPDVTADDEPTDVIVLLPSGSSTLCAFWDYEGMEDGLIWDALWYSDGEFSENVSIIGESWGGGETGNWWVCISNEDGLPDSLYEVIFQVQGELIASKSIFVGDDHDVAQVDIQNDTDTDVCAFAFSPNTSQNWGLGLADLPAGDSITVDVATGTYDILALDCNFDTLEEVYGIEVDAEGGIYHITGVLE